MLGKVVCEGKYTYHVNHVICCSLNFNLKSLSLLLFYGSVTFCLVHFRLVLICLVLIRL